MCPPGFTWFDNGEVDGTCIVAVMTPKQSPITARSECYNNYGSYHLLTLPNAQSLESVKNLLATLSPDASAEIWIGLDNSLRTNNFGGLTVDPDNDWEWDRSGISGVTSANTPYAGFWSPGEPVASNGWAYLQWNETQQTVTVSTVLKDQTAVSAWYICERPSPCLQCEDGWAFFDGHCYQRYNRPQSKYGMQYYRAHCQFLDSFE